MDTGKGSRSTVECFVNNQRVMGPKTLPSSSHGEGHLGQWSRSGMQAPELPPAFPVTHYLKHRLPPSSPRPALPPPSLPLHYSH